MEQLSLAEHRFPLRCKAATGLRVATDTEQFSLVRRTMHGQFVVGLTDR
jgi:hypothetical protein